MGSTTESAITPAITWAFVLTARISVNTSNLTNSGSWNAFLMPTPEIRFVFDSTVIQLQPTLARQHHREQCNHAKSRVALAVPPFIHPDSLRRRLCTFSRLQKGQGSSKTPRTRAQNLPYLFAILGFLPTIETPKHCRNLDSVSTGRMLLVVFNEAISLPRLTHVAENTQPSRRRPIWKRACIFLSERGTKTKCTQQTQI
jgi:hypothetical protein